MKPKNKKLLLFLQHHLIGLPVLAGLVAITAIITLNLTFIYPWIIEAYNLERFTGLDADTLMHNYRILIAYNNIPWITTLYMPDFPMSASGEFHFWEVWVIFFVLQLIAFVLIIWIVASVWKKWKLLEYFNAAGNLTIFIFGTFLAIMLIDFDFFFYWFHRAFFNNDYWLFDARTDPVIRALPAELFMIKGFIIIGFLFIIAVVAKVFHYTGKKKKIN